jgi:hypothetical protein
VNYVTRHKVTKEINVLVESRSNARRIRAFTFIIFIISIINLSVRHVFHAITNLQSQSSSVALKSLCQCSCLYKSEVQHYGLVGKAATFILEGDREIGVLTEPLS